jgi:hypothetical protein
MNAKLIKSNLAMVMTIALNCGLAVAGEKIKKWPKEVMFRAIESMTTRETGDLPFRP